MYSPESHLLEVSTTLALMFKPQIVANEAYDGITFTALATLLSQPVNVYHYPGKFAVVPQSSHPEDV